MHPEQASSLYRELFHRRVIKCSGNSPRVYEVTHLTRMLRAAGAPEVFSNAEWDRNMSEDERVKAAAFLRKWADALESSNL